MENKFVLMHQLTEIRNFSTTKSITLLLTLVEGNKKFICVDIGQYGRASNGNVFGNSNIGKRLIRLSFGLPPDENVGDTCLPYVCGEVFPLKHYLMRSYPRSIRRLSGAERIFNYKLSRSRNTVENVFDILANI